MERTICLELLPFETVTKDAFVTILMQYCDHKHTLHSHQNITCDLMWMKMSSEVTPARRGSIFRLTLKGLIKTIVQYEQVIQNNTSLSQVLPKLTLLQSIL